MWSSDCAEQGARILFSGLEGCAGKFLQQALARQSAKLSDTVSGATTIAKHAMGPRSFSSHKKEFLNECLKRLYRHHKVPLYPWSWTQFEWIHEYVILIAIPHLLVRTFSHRSLIGDMGYGTRVTRTSMWHGKGTICSARKGYSINGTFWCEEDELDKTALGFCDIGCGISAE